MQKEKKFKPLQTEYAVMSTQFGIKPSSCITLEHVREYDSVTNIFLSHP